MEPLSISSVQTNISRTLYSRLLAYQHLLAIRFYRRRYSATGNYILPASAAHRFSPFGSIRLVDGKVTVKAAVLSVLQQQGIECLDLNSTNNSTCTGLQNDRHGTRNNNFNFPIPIVNIHYAG
eukprot:4082806-Pleurochrysis_carterae.AAC.1